MRFIADLLCTVGSNVLIDWLIDWSIDRLIAIPSHLRSKHGVFRLATCSRHVPRSGRSDWRTVDGNWRSVWHFWIAHRHLLEHQIRRSAPSSVISRPTCFSSSLRCCWQVGSAPFVRRRCDCSSSSAPFTNIQTYLLTYLLTYIALFRASSLPVLPIPLRQHSSVINLHANEIPFLLAVFNFERYQRQTYRKMYMFSMAPIRNSVPRGRSKKKTGGLYIGEDFLGMRLLPGHHPLVFSILLSRYDLMCWTAAKRFRRRMSREVNSTQSPFWILTAVYWWRRARSQ